jgi:hypothetical protein
MDEFHFQLSILNYQFPFPMAKSPQKPQGFVANNLVAESSPLGLNTEAEVLETEEVNEGYFLLKDLEDVYTDTIIRLIAVNGRNQSPIRLTPFQTRSGRLMTGQEDIPLEEKKKKYVQVVDAYTNYTLIHNMTLDLNNPYDVITWNWVKYFPLLALKAENVNEDTLFFVENKKDFVRKKISLREKRDRASDIIRDANVFEIVDICLLIGEKAENFARQELVEQLRDIADKDPDRILSKVDSPDRAYYSMIKHLAQLGYFTVNNGTYSYKNATIGRDEQGTVAWLKDRNNLDEFNYLQRELKNAHRI